MKSLKKFILNFDLITGVLGLLLIYFAENIVTTFYPTSTVPAHVMSLLMYYTIYSIAVFWGFKAISYLTLRIFWNDAYLFFENQFTEHYNTLTGKWKLFASLLLYFSLFFILENQFTEHYNTLTSKWKHQ